jgi:ABC-type sulfate transport system permease component
MWVQSAWLWKTMPLAIIYVFDAGRSIDVAIALAVMLILVATLLLVLLRLVARSAGRPTF